MCINGISQNTCWEMQAFAGVGDRGALCRKEKITDTFLFKKKKIFAQRGHEIEPEISQVEKTGKKNIKSSFEGGSISPASF